MSTRLDAARAELAKYHALHDWLAAEVEAKNWVAYDEIAEQLAKVNEASTRRPAPIVTQYVVRMNLEGGILDSEPTSDRVKAQRIADELNAAYAQARSGNRAGVIEVSQ